MWSDMFPREEANLLSKLVTGKPQTIYAGFDPTAPSLHVGHMAVVSSLLMCQRAGHRVIAVVGGATALVGDPSGKKSDRPELAGDAVGYNAAQLESQLKRLFSNHEELFWPEDWKKRFPLQPALILNNMDWYKQLDLLTFLKQASNIASASFFQKIILCLNP
jgi:tyrosyl-tRNA synthetase